MPATVAVPGGPATGAVVVVQEAFGVTGHIADVAARLARAGWQAVAPALFHRQGSPVIAYDDIQSALPVMGQLTAGGITSDMLATLSFLEEAGFPAAKVGVVGFCMGGTLSLYMGTLRPIGAAVTYYGGGVATGRFGLPSLAKLAPTLVAPWLGLYGDEDQSIPVEEVEELRRAAAQAKVDTEVVRYAGAGHGFHCDDRPTAFRAEAARDGWRRTLGWFDRHLAG
ncbi:MAG: dienelactone hydrolase family protein [Acidimicrobiales bacterium]